MSEPGFQESYSHEIAVVFPGTDRHKELLDRCRDMEKRLPFEIHLTGEEAT